MYYPCSENKDADQLHGYREADLRLCFRICRLLVLPVMNISSLVITVATILETQKLKISDVGILYRGTGQKN